MNKKADAILLTAFEPSGDAHAAPVVEALRKTAPGRPIYALGGPRMQAAGAQLIEQTTERAVMLGSALGQAREHRRRVGRLSHWLSEHPVAGHVPVDSPAANWAICKLVRKHQPAARITHLVGPQLWAWAPWRIGKLRRLTDHVMCLLPFEPGWFEPRGVRATFVGHPVFEEAPAPSAAPDDGPLTLLPGSRMAEVRRNWPTMRAAFETLRRDDPSLEAVVALRDAGALALLDEIDPRRPTGLTVRVGQTAEALAAARAVLVVSGTATLQVAAHRRPMVALFNASPITWHLLGRWLIQTRTFTLPNLISESQGWGRAIDEFVPHFGDPAPIAEALKPLLYEDKARAAAVAKLQRIAQLFDQRDYARRCAAIIEAELARERAS